MRDAEKDIDPKEPLDDVEVIEIVTEDVDHEGNTIVDDAIFVVDGAGRVVAQHESITFESPDGDVMRSTLGDDGQMHIV